MGERVDEQQPVAALVPRRGVAPLRLGGIGVAGLQAEPAVVLPYDTDADLAIMRGRAATALVTSSDSTSSASPAVSWATPQVPRTARTIARARGTLRRARGTRKLSS
ncbi:hypothetical protein [Streptomyces sp. CA-250714]|uniref:hypothetical protein n=1 Tax=Streptomyces sp. CA-250714 TaxID=3240060 RepID=UPI003D93C31A